MRKLVTLLGMVFILSSTLSIPASASPAPVLPPNWCPLLFSSPNTQFCVFSGTSSSQPRGPKGSGFAVIEDVTHEPDAATVNNTNITIHKWSKKKSKWVQIKTQNRFVIQHGGGSGGWPDYWTVLWLISSNRPALGSYMLTFSSEVKDVDGNPLDQDSNTNGAQPFRVIFKVVKGST